MGILLYFLILKVCIMAQYKYVLSSLSFTWNIGYVCQILQAGYIFTFG
jgi:hypothetical protein